MVVCDCDVCVAVVLCVAVVKKELVSQASQDRARYTRSSTIICASNEKSIGRGGGGLVVQYTSIKN